MSNIERYDFHYFDDFRSKYSAFREECPDGEYVSFDDYATLEAQRVALAAENAGLKNFIKNDCWIFHPDVEMYSDAMDYVPETPATDRFIADVKAQDSAPLVKALTTIANSEQHSGETVVCDFYTLISVASGALRDYYAQQLRGEKAE
ncbi:MULTISPECIES: hypothetical protein [Enterobacterales]|uniref:hypothetical protein n=1 Tax=Enterobacterales TaxID=91347 RepID=UPI002ED7B377